MPYKGTCTNCKEKCNVIAVDYGIGAYEYWGAPGNDIRIEIVSDCCEAPAVDDFANTVTAKDLADYNTPDFYL